MNTEIEITQVDLTDTGLYIEIESENEKGFESYEVECSEDEMVAWFIDQYGSSETHDYYDPRDSHGHGQTTNNFSDKQIVMYINEDYKLRNKLALSMRDKWSVCEE
jgi:hypothetical protein